MIEDVGDDRDGREREHNVPPHQAVPEALRHREEQEDQRERERDVHRPQDVRGNDLDRGIEVEHRHDDREQGHQDGERALVAVLRAFFLLDELLEALAAVLR